MSDHVLVRRYAEGYIQSVQGTVGQENALEELKSFKMILREHPDFKLFLETPVILHSEKFRLVERVCEGYSAEFKNFLFFLIEKRRIGLLAEIMDYLRLQYAHQAETYTLLKVSSVLDLEIIQEIKEKLQKKLNQPLKLYIQLDGDLLGGINATAGNTFMDGSIQGSLRQLKEKLMQLKMS